MNKVFKEGDHVYLDCKVTKVPYFDDHLYRLVSKNEGTVIWATADEIVLAPDEVENSFDILKEADSTPKEVYESIDDFYQKGNKIS